MSTYFGSCQLTGHDPDPEESNHKVVPGHWVAASCEEREAFAKAVPDTLELRVWSGLTDPAGEFGEPQMFTEWGSRDGTTPVMADLRHLPHPGSADMADPKPCEHRIYRVDTPAETEHVATPEDDGWSCFGTHSDLPGLLEFSTDLDEAGMPLWERPIERAEPPVVTGMVADALADKAHCLCSETSLSQGLIYIDCPRHVYLPGILREAVSTALAEFSAIISSVPNLDDK